MAWADLTAPELQARGEQLARDGRYTEAIDAFKAADRIEPRASHACLIALAYTRRELWSQAEIFLDKCHLRATAADPLPEWVDEADKQIETRLAEANAAPIEITVEPGGTQVELTVSSFPPDETFEPRTIHLAPGHHVIIAKAPSFEPTQHALDVADKTPQHVTINLAHHADRGPTPTEHERGFPSLVKWGGVVALAGFASWGVMGYSYFKLTNAADDNAFHSGPYSTTYDVTRITTAGLWAIGAGLMITGYLTRDHESAAVAVVPTRGGGFVSLGWQE